MQAFLIKVLIAAITSPEAQALLKKLLDEAVADVETNILNEIEKLPAQIAQQVTGEVSPLLDPPKLAQAIVTAMTGGGQKPPWWPF